MRRPKADTRDLILRVAGDVLLERGSAATAQDIWQRAGIASSSFYRCFGTEDGMWVELRDSILAARQGRVMAPFTATDRTAAGVVTAAVEACLRWGSRETRSARLLMLLPACGIGSDAAMTGVAEHLRREIAILETWAAPLIADGSFRDLPAATLHALIFGQADLAVRSWLAGGSRDDLPALAPVLGQAAWAAIKAEAAPRPRARAGTTQDAPTEQAQRTLSF